MKDQISAKLQSESPCNATDPIQCDDHVVEHNQSDHKNSYALILKACMPFKIVMNVEGWGTSRLTGHPYHIHLLLHQILPPPQQSHPGTADTQRQDHSYW